MHRLKSFVTAAIAAGSLVIPHVIKADSIPNLALVIPLGSSSTADMTGDASSILYRRVTAYSSTPDQTDSTPFITASGLPVGDGIVASNILPFGTKIKIPALFGDKIFTVEDRMSQKIKNTIDIWMVTRNSALRFGVHTAEIVVLPAVQKVQDATDAVLSINK